MGLKIGLAKAEEKRIAVYNEHLNELCYWLANIPGIGAVKIRRLLERFDTPERIYNIEEKELEDMSVLSKKDREAIVYARSRAQEYHRAYHKMRERGIQFITIYNPVYPKRLTPLPDRPFGLYIKGELPRDETASAAVVGARRCTGYGREMARHFGKELSRQGIQIVSGMASGVDGASQRGALSGGGKSFAVLGSGVDVCYPREHINLYTELQQHGGIISEFPPGTPPSPGHFPMRNRIISGLADVLIVIEAREQSGSLITVDFALEQGKEVFVLPGRLDDELSRGCNKLIKNGANLLTSPEDITDFFGFYGRNLLRTNKNQNLGLANEEEMVYSGLDLHPKHLEAIVVETGLAAAACMAALVSLETKGLISGTAGNYYAKKL